MRYGYADTRVGQIHYRELGAGPPLLLLHQTSSSSVNWARVQPLLAESFRTIAIDTPGFGMSAPPPGPPAGMRHYAAAAVGVLDALGIERAHVVGFHTGSSIAIELGARHGERVGRLVLSGLLACSTEAERQEWIEKIMHPFELDGRGEYVTANVLPWVAYFARGDDPEQYHRELIATLQAAPTWWWAQDAVIRYDAYAVARELACPTLIVNASDDPVYNSTLLLAEQLPEAGYVEVPGDTRVLVDHPEPFAEVVSAFLSEAPARAPLPPRTG